MAPATTNVVYGVGSAPLVFNQTGVRRFCSEEDGVASLRSERSWRYCPNHRRYRSVRCGSLPGPAVKLLAC